MEKSGIKDDLFLEDAVIGEGGGIGNIATLTALESIRD